MTNIRWDEETSTAACFEMTQIIGEKTITMK